MEESEEQKRINAEVQRQVNEALQEYAKILANASAGITNLTGKVNTASTITAQSAAKQAEASGKSAAMQEAAAKATEDYNKAMGNLSAATQSAVTGAKQLGTAFLSTEKGFSKFGEGLKSAGDAAFNLGKMIGGPLGLAVGALLKGATMAADAALKQADNTLKATDSLSKLGGAGAFTANQVLAMGHNAGLTSANLDVMTKAAGKAGTGMAGLGSTVAGGIKAFGDMVAVSKEQRMAFQRMGVSQEELMAQQADYVKLQELSGVNLADQVKNGKNLKAASLEYAENLLRLSALTGKSADDLTKEKMIANEVYEEQIQTQMEQAKIRQLKAEGRDAEAADIQRQQENRKRAAEEYVHTFGKEQGLQMARAVRTGSFDKSTAGLATIGFDPAAEKRKLEEAKSKEEVDRLTAATKNDMKQKREQMLLANGTAVQYGGEKLGKALGLGGVETAQAYGRMGSRDEVAANAEATKRTAGTAQGKGDNAAANDPAQIARNKLTEAEIAAKVELDKLLASVNPLLTGFNATTIAATALTAAAVLAAAYLTKMAMQAKMGDLMGKSGPGFEKGGKVAAGGKAMGALGKMAGGVSRFAGPVAGAVAVGAGALHAYEGYQNVEKQVAEGKLTKEQGTVKKSEAVGEGAGQAVGGAGGAWAGAAAGAAIGSVIPVVGTAIGGLLGAALGGWLGSKGGEVVGKAAGTATGQMLTKTDKAATAATAAAVGLDKNKKPMTVEEVAKDTEIKAKLQLDQTKVTSNLDTSSKSLKKSIDDLKQAIDDLTSVASIKDATGSEDDKKKKLEGVYNRLGIGSGSAGGSSSSGSAPGGSSSGGAMPAGGTSPSGSSSGGAMPSGGPSGGATRSEPMGGSESQPSSGPSSSGAGPKMTPEEQVKKAGLKVRPTGDVYQGGLLTDNTVRVAQTVQSMIPEFGMFTGLNDMYHQQKHPRSKHALGRGIDLVLGSKVTPERSAEIQKIMEGIGGTKVFDEYYYPPGAAKGNYKGPERVGGGANQYTTGGHFHIDVARDGGMFDGPEEGFPVMLHGKETVIPNAQLTELLNNAEMSTKRALPPELTGAASDNTQGSSDLAGFMEDFKEFMGMKIDELKDVMEEGNGISDKILTYSKV